MSQERNNVWQVFLFVVISLVLWPIHFVGCVLVSYQLFRMAGGIKEIGLWTQYGGIEWSWTNFAWPGGVLTWAGGERLGLFAILFMALGSGVASLTVSSLISRLLFGLQSDLGIWKWRIWLPLVLWLGWVPVPVRMTLTYWHTVAY